MASENYDNRSTYHNPDDHGEPKEDVLSLANQVLTAYHVGFSLISIITFVGLVANVFVVVIILSSRRLRNTVYNVYIVSLCISSFLFLLVWGLTEVIRYGLYLHRGFFYIHNDSKIRKLMVGGEVSTMVVTCFMVTALAVDRFIVVARPAALLPWRTVKNAHVTCAIVWAAGLLSACVCIPVDLYTPIKTSYTIIAIFFVITFAIPMIVIAVCLGLTIKANALSRKDSTLSPTGRRSLRRQTRFLVLVVGVSLSFFICWAYWYGYYLALWPLLQKGAFFKYSMITHISLHMLTDILVLFNTALNPFLYALNRPHIRGHLRRLCSCGRKSEHAAGSIDAEESTQASSAAQSNGDVTTETAPVTPGDGGVTFNVANETVVEIDSQPS